MKARKHWRLGLAGLTVVFAGCQGNAKAYRYIEAINAERRALEDRVYALEDDLQSLDMELGEALAENDQLRRDLGKDPQDARRRTQERPARQPAARPPATRRDPPSDGELAPPQIDGGTLDEVTSSADMAPTPVTSQGEPAEETLPPPANDPPGGLLLPPPPASGQGAGKTKREPKLITTAATLATNDRQVVRIALDPARTSGADFDGKRGDDGVTVLIQCKNDAGQVVLDPGAISVALLDPNRPADQARVARWDLNAQQVTKLAEDPAANGGWKLHFAWPDRPPTATLLRLYVRYTTTDGQHFDAEQEIHIELPPGARSSRPDWRAER